MLFSCALVLRKVWTLFFAGTVVAIMIGCGLPETGDPGLQFSSFSDHLCTDSPFTVTAQSLSSGAVSYSVLSGPASIKGSTVTLSGVPGTVVIQAQVAATNTFRGATAQAMFNVNAATLADPHLVVSTISDHIRTDSPFAISAKSQSTAPITFSLVGGPASVSGSTVSLTGDVGSVTVQAQIAKTTQYEAATAQTTFQVTSSPSALSFRSAWIGPSSMALTSVSPSNAPVSYKVTSGPGTVSGSTLSISGAGHIVINAVQPATAEFLAASVTQTIEIAASKLTFAPQNLGFPNTGVGNSSPAQPVRVTNTGDVTAELQGTTVSNGFSSTNTCGNELAAHTSCSMTVAFSPTTAGTTSGQALIQADSGVYPLPLVGTGVTTRVPDLTGASLTQLLSGKATGFHLFGHNLDLVKNVVAGGTIYPVIINDTADISVTISPPAWASGSISLRGQAETGDTNSVSLALVSPPVSYDTAVRFAQQATMSVTPDQIAQIQQRGLAGWIDWQMSTDMFPYETRSDMVYGTYMTNTQVTQYALRQRMTLALKEIYTFGASDACFATQCGHFWEARLQKDAFGNERDLLTDVTLSPLMGNFLNNARNFMNYPFTGTHRANQNYARELMQLMTIGPNRLNHDGSTALDANGNQIANYSEDNISDMAAAMSGYYMTGVGQYAKVTDGDPLTPMSLWEVAHSPLAKDPLPGLHLPASNGGAADTKAVLDALFNHPNIGPFLARRFIQHFVTSNPSPEYISRIAGVFENDGTGVRGNLGAVVKAVLLDPEARRGDDPTTAVDTDSHMMEPLLYISNVMSAVGGVYSDDRVYLVIDVMGQDLFMSPTVFGPYSPDNRIVTGEYAPEMQLVNNAGYLERITFVQSMVSTGLPGMPCSLTLSPFYNAPDAPSVLEQMRHFLFHGRMPAALDSALQAYVAANPNLSPNALLPGLLQIALISGSYQVMR